MIVILIGPTQSFNSLMASYIEFFSADNDAKLRGARRDILYMNECNNMTFYAYTELASRTKQRGFFRLEPYK